MQVHCPLSQELQRFKLRCKNGNASTPVRPSAEAVTGRNTPVRGQDQKYRGDEAKQRELRGHRTQSGQNLSTQATLVLRVGLRLFFKKKKKCVKQRRPML
jgi:hypothetical protein